MKRIFPIFLSLSAIGFFAVHWLSFVYVPMEAEMRASQRIFYIHLPSAWLCYLGFVVCFAASLGFLITRKAKWDAAAVAAADVGLLFGVVVLITGPLWARAAWGVWWKWEPRLTTMAILFLIFSGYRLLRTFGGEGSGARVFSSVLAVFGAPQIYFVHIAVTRWQGDHPNNVTMTSDMRVALYSNLLIMLVFFILLLRLVYRVRVQALTASALRRRLARMGA